MDGLDAGFESAKQIIESATANLDNIQSEEDAKLQIIHRLLMESLGWNHSAIRAERHHDSGFSDFILYDGDHPAFLIEAKRIGRIRLNQYADRLQYYKLSGPALSDALAAVKQAASYCTPDGIQLAAVTDGITWIIFLPYIPGQPYLSKQAAVFPTFSSILSDFSTFFALLSKSECRKNTFKLVFDRIHENRLVLSHSLTAPFSDADIHTERKSDLAFNLEKVFASFFSGMSGDADQDLLIECFVETRESRIADYALERITSNVLGNITTKPSSIEEGLTNVVSNTVAGELGQTVFIVGPSGAGKSTFLDRFFRKTLNNEVRSSCVVLNLNVLDATGDLSSNLHWLREESIHQIESQVYTNGHPSWNDLLGLYHTEYVRRAEGVDRPLYQRSKDEFREHFSKVVDLKVEQDREGYLRRLLSDLVHNRKFLPIFIIDNTDEFELSYKTAVFQYFQALRREISHCLLIFPSTVRSAWSFSKSEIFNIYSSRSFYLPTPSPREVLRKRVDYLKNKVSMISDQSEKGQYFTERGIRISIGDLKQFASIVEGIFVNEDYTSRRVGELSNYNIRKTLRLSQRIITSPVMAIEDVVSSYIAGQMINISPQKFMSCLLKGDYNFFKRGDEHEIINVYQVDDQIKQSPLMQVRILTLLADLHRKAVEDEKRYLEVGSIYNYFELMAIPEIVTEKCLISLLIGGLVEPYDLSMTEYSQSQKLAITHSGLCHLALAKNSPTFFEQMALTTSIVNRDIAELIRSNYLSNTPYSEKMENIRHTFCRYIYDEDKVHISIPNTPEFTRQKNLGDDLLAHWSVVDRPEEAEQIALYGVVEDEAKCNVEWFDRIKGFGFVKVAKLQDSAFLHARILETANIDEVSEGDELICELSQNAKGLVVTSLVKAVPRATLIFRGPIVHLNEVEGYGFVHLGNVEQDAFFRYSQFSRPQRELLACGLEIEVEVTKDQQKGYQVRKVIS